RRRLRVELRLQRGRPDRGSHVAHGAGRARNRFGCAGSLLCGFLLAGGGGGCPATARELQPVDLADHRIAADATELGRDLAGAQALRPQLLQKFDTFVSPVHATALLLKRAAAGILSRPGSRRADTTYIGMMRSAARNLAISRVQLPYGRTL